MRARNFARCWGYIQASQALPNLLGVPLAGYINTGWGSKTGYYFSAACVLLGSASLSLIDLHKRQLRRKRHQVGLDMTVTVTVTVTVTGASLPSMKHEFNKL